MIRKNDSETELYQEFWEEEAERSEAEVQPKKKVRRESFFPAILLFQVTLCLAAAILFVLMNTFYPDEYQSMDRDLKERLAKTENFRKDGEKAAETVQTFLNEKLKLSEWLPDSSHQEQSDGSAP